MRLGEITMRKTNTGFGMTQYDSEDFVLAGGFRSGNSGAGTTRLKYMIYDRKFVSQNAEPEEIGVVELFVNDKTGMIEGLVNIEIYKKFRKSGYGSRIVKDIKDTAEGDLTIYDIQKKAKKFWDKLGVQYTGKSIKSGRGGEWIVRKLINNSII